MARVPVPAPDGVDLRPLPGGGLRPVQASNLEAVGTAIQQGGNQLAAYADRQVEIDRRFDETQAKKADTSGSAWLREQLWTGDNAYFTKQGVDALNARPLVEKAIKDKGEEIASSLTSPRQQKMFRSVWEQRSGAELVGVAKYAVAESVAEEDKASLGLLTNEANNAVTFWKDPDRLEMSIGTGLIELRNMADKRGWLPERLHQAENEYRANVYSRIVSSQITADPLGAKAFLDDHRDVIDPDSEMKLDGQLYRPLLERQGEGIIDGIMGVASLSLSTTPNTSPIAGGSGGGSLSAYALPGSHKTSGYGWRVDPINGQRKWHSGTDMAAPAGTPVPAAAGGKVIFAKETKGGYGNRVVIEHPDGSQSSYSHLQGFNVAEGQTVGAGATIGRVGSTGRSTGPHLHFEVLKGKGKVDPASAKGGAGDDVVQQQPQRHDLNRLLADVDKMELPFDVEQYVKNGIRGRVAQDEQLLNRRADQAIDEAWGVVGPLGDNFTSISQIPPAVLSGMTNQQRATFMGLAERNQKSGTSREDTDWSAYSQFSDEYARNPAAFARRSPAELRAKLGDTEFKQVMGWRQDAVSGKAKGQESEQQVAHSRVESVTKDLLLQAGVVRPPDPPGARARDPEADKAYYARIGKFQRAVSADISAWNAANPSKKIDDDKILELADRQLIKVWDRDARGGKVARGFQFEAPTSASVRSIPTADVERIRRAYVNRWGRKPSDQEVYEVYRYGPRGGR